MRKVPSMTKGYFEKEIIDLYQLIKNKQFPL